MKRAQSYKHDLVHYRLDLAGEMLRDARLLQENGGSPMSVVNRAYYAVFYAALALLVTVEIEPTKHAGVLAKFDELFVRQEMSRILHHAFDMRQAGDYQKSKVITDEQAFEVLTSANEFVETVQKKLSQGLQ